MAEFPEDFNPADVPEDDRSFEPLPAGEYTMQVIESEIKPTTTGGEQLVLTCEVMTGPYSNRRIWDRLNIRNANPETQRWAQRSLADLCLAVGVASLRNSDSLHFIPFTGRVSIVPAKEKDIKAGYPDPKNRIKYRSNSGARPAGASTATQAAKPATQASKPAATGAKPWQRANA